MTPAPAPTLVPEHTTTEQIPSLTVVPVPRAADDLPVDSISAGTLPNADAAACELPAARRATATQRKRTRELERTVRQLHAHLNGDASTPLRELHRLHRQLLQTLADHHQGAQALPRQLQQCLPAQTSSA